MDVRSRLLGIVLGALAVGLGWFLGQHRSSNARDEAVLLLRELRSLVDRADRHEAALETIAGQLNAILTSIRDLSAQDTGPAVREVPAAAPLDEVHPTEVALSREDKVRALRAIYAACYEGFSDVYILNRVLESQDPELRAFGLGLFLDGVTDPKFLMSHTRNPTLGAQSVVIAEALAQHAESTRDALISEYPARRFPSNFVIALALHMQGESSYLDQWSVTALQDFDSDSISHVDRCSVLDACVNFSIPDGESIALSAAKSEEPRIRLHSIVLLAKLAVSSDSARAMLETLTRDPDPMVASRAQIRLLELPIASTR